MAQSKNNIITHGLSGKVGDILVFSQRGDRTIVGKVPKAHAGGLSEKQKEHTLKFQQAVLYAKSALEDAATNAAYTAVAHKDKGITGYNVAVADLFHAPEIERIDLSNYTGNIGDKITVQATDDFKVAAVKVIIHNADGSLVEQGNAIQQGANWVYTATVKNDSLAGDKITVQATDTPANLSETTQSL